LHRIFENDTILVINHRLIILRQTFKRFAVEFPLVLDAFGGDQPAASTFQRCRVNAKNHGGVAL
jgi:hypothetical protein